MRSPAFAIAWEIWWRHRAGMTLLPCGLLLCGFLNRTAFRQGEWAGFAVALSYAVLAMAMILTFGFFHFTEGQRKGGFGSYPQRLFRMPVPTAWLAAWPMIYGTAAVGVLYLACDWLMFVPLDRPLPKLWPCLYLVSGFTLYQAILWSFPERRYLKLFLLTLGAMFIAFCWMFFLPHMIEGTLADWGYEGSPKSVQRGLLVFFAATGPAAWGFSWLRLRGQRHGIAEGVRGGAAVIERLAEWLPARTERFASPDAALFWHEWRQTGFILPLAVAGVLAMTCIPSWLSGPLTGQTTMGLLTWMVIAPVLLAAIIGRGFAKPDFWSPQLGVPAFIARRPVSAGQIVFAKLKAALCSVSLTWGMTGITAVVWFAAAGDFGGIDALLAQGKIYYPGGQRWLLAGLLLAGGMMLSWRFLVSGLAAGLSGAKGWFYASNGITAAILVGILACFIWTGDNDDHPIRLYNLWPWVEWLPAILCGLVIAKLATAAWAWSRAHEAGMVGGRGVAGYFAAWILAAALLALAAGIAFPNTPWLRNLLWLCAALVPPLAGPGVALITWSANRTGGSP